MEKPKLIIARGSLCRTPWSESRGDTWRQGQLLLQAGVDWFREPGARPVSTLQSREGTGSASREGARLATHGRAAERKLNRRTDRSLFPVISFPSSSL